MSTFIKVVGGIWAFLGGLNVVMMDRGESEDLTAFTIIFNFLVFVIPGLALYGIGSLMERNRPRHPAIEEVNTVSSGWHAGPNFGMIFLVVCFILALALIVFVYVDTMD
ncbi:hypothetical protein ACFLRO_00585 [Bacteroidota bacterium]